MGVTGNRSKTDKSNDNDYRLKRNIKILPSVPSESGIKNIEINNEIIKPDPNLNIVYNTNKQNGGVPLNQNGFPINQNGYQNEINQTVDKSNEIHIPHRDGIIHASNGTNSIHDINGGHHNYIRNGVSYTNGNLKPMGELRSSLKKREADRMIHEDRDRDTPDGYRMKDDTIMQNEYPQMGKKYTKQEIDLNKELIKKEKEKLNLELQNQYYDEYGNTVEYTNEKPHRKQTSLGRDIDYHRAEPHQTYNKRDKMRQSKHIDSSPDEDDEDLDNEELAKLSKRYRQSVNSVRYDYDSTDEDEMPRKLQISKHLSQEHLERVHNENKKNYYKQKSADELYYITERIHKQQQHKQKQQEHQQMSSPIISRTNNKILNQKQRSKTPDFDYKFKKEHEDYQSKQYDEQIQQHQHQKYKTQYYSDNEIDFIHEDIKKTNQQYEINKTDNVYNIYKDNWRQQIIKDEENKRKEYLNKQDIEKQWKMNEKYNIPPPNKFNDNDDDDSLSNLQIPSVSFLVTDRGKKIKPTITSSPIKTSTVETAKDWKDREVLEDRITPQSAPANSKNKYFFNSVRSSSPDGSKRILTDNKSSVSVPTTPGDPGFVKHLASNWPDSKKE